MFNASHACSTYLHARAYIFLYTESHHVGAYMECVSLDGLNTLDVFLPAPAFTMLMCKLHQAGDPPGKGLGGECRGHQLPHVQMIIEGHDSYRSQPQEPLHCQRPFLCIALPALHLA